MRRSDAEMHVVMNGNSELPIPSENTAHQTSLFSFSLFLNEHFLLYSSLALYESLNDSLMMLITPLFQIKNHIHIHATLSHSLGTQTRERLSSFIPIA
jgi:hypothetical protein